MLPPGNGRCCPSAISRCALRVLAGPSRRRPWERPVTWRVQQGEPLPDKPLFCRVRNIVRGTNQSQHEIGFLNFQFQKHPHRRTPTTNEALAASSPALPVPFLPPAGACRDRGACIIQCRIQSRRLASSNLLQRAVSPALTFASLCLWIAADQTGDAELSGKM